MYKLLFVNFMVTLTIMATEVVATVDGKDITREDVDRFIARAMPGAKYSLMNNEQKRKTVEKLIKKELYLKVAKRERIDKDPEFAVELERQKENIMLDIWMKRKLENIRVSDREIKRYYMENDSKFYQSATASARHILVSTEAEAREIIRELENASNLREKFIELARTRSTGPSAKNGGDLGWFSKDQMVPEFSDATFALSPGNITHAPVQTFFGYHIIYLTDKKPAGKIEFFKVKDKIRESLKLKKFKEYLENLNRELRKSANIRVK